MQVRFIGASVMKLSRKVKAGFTLVEVMVVVAVAAIMVSLLVVAGQTIRTQSQKELAASTISILVTALEQYHDFYDRFPEFPPGGFAEDYQFSATELAELLAGPGATIEGGRYIPAFASSSAVYYYLRKVPASRKILGSIADSLVTSYGADGSERLVLVAADVGDEPAVLARVIDPWGTPLRYRYDAEWSFPEITSAGPDGKFHEPDASEPVISPDDITSSGL